jgi:hypothetical protein
MDKDKEARMSTLGDLVFETVKAARTNGIAGGEMVIEAMGVQKAKVILLGVIARGDEKKDDSPERYGYVAGFMQAILRAEAKARVV